MRWYDAPVKIEPAEPSDDPAFQQVAYIYNIAIITMLSQGEDVIPVTDRIECYET